LEQRVEVKHQQLVKKHAKLQVLENQRILTEERERLVLDMHDGLGGSLVSTLAMIDLGKASMDDIAEALRTSLDDLNLMINSMDLQEDELSGLLGNFRARMTSRLHNSNIQLVWNVQDIPNIPGFNPRSALQILRILQEAVTNTLKHAQASKIWISAYSYITNTDSYVMIEIRDNGKGNNETNKHGRGTQNMYRRALRLGSKLSIKSDSSGTVIQLMVPVDKK